MNRQDRRKALGKGLGSLLPTRNAPAPAPAAHEPETPREGSVAWIPIDRVKPNADQPRHEFDPVAMMELTQSIERD